MSQVPHHAPPALGAAQPSRRARRASATHREARRPRRVLVVADGRLLAAAIAALLREAGMEARAGDADALVDGPAAPDLAIVGPGTAAQVAELAAAVRDLHPDVPVVALVGEADAATIAVASRAGLAGLLDLHGDAPELAHALRRVAEGATVYPATVVHDRRAQAAAALSDRQRDVLRLLAEGRTNAEIAQELMVSVNTVKFHVRSIFRALRICSRVEAALAWTALQHHPLG